MGREVVFRVSPERATSERENADGFSHSVPVSQSEREIVCCPVCVWCNEKNENGVTVSAASVHPYRSVSL